MRLVAFYIVHDRSCPLGVGAECACTPRSLCADVDLDAPELDFEDATRQDVADRLLLLRRAATAQAHGSARFWDTVGWPE